MSTVRILNSSASVEWYTPPRYVEAARAVLGKIELDPASCAEAQETVKADRWYGLNGTGGAVRGISEIRLEHVDALRAEWHARTVFLNPPYGVDEHHQSNQGVWSNYLLKEYRAGHVGSAILLVNNSPSEKWFHPLKYFPICETDHRIKYNYPKLRRIAWTAISGLGADRIEQRKLLAEKLVRIWVDGKGWRTAGKRGATTRNESKALVMPFREAYGWDDYYGASELSFDRQDKPTQPTKGQAFIFLPSDDTFRQGDPGESDPLIWPHDQLISFTEKFAAFGQIYLPAALAFLRIAQGWPNA